MHVTCAHVFAYYDVQQNSSRATLTSPPHSLHQPLLLFSGFTEISLSFLACRYFVILYILARKRWDCQEGEKIYRLLYINPSPSSRDQKKKTYPIKSSNALGTFLHLLLLFPRHFPNQRHIVTQITLLHHNIIL